MSHYAQVIDGIVQQVLVIEKDVLDSGAFGDPSQWIQTSYNTIGGVHKNGGTPLRKNFAGVGYIYDAERDAFYTPQPYPSWVLDEQTCWWYAPKPAPIDPDGKIYEWSEEQLDWVPITI